MRPVPLVVIAFLTALAAPAQAAVTVKQSAGVLVVEGDSAVDQVTIFKDDPFDAGNTTFYVSRDGGGITSDGSALACVPAAGTTVRCDWSAIGSMQVQLGGGNDRITGGSPAPAVPAILDGEAGDDTYRPNSDSVGPDRFDDTGSGGHDTLDMSGVTTAGFYALGDGVANDGRWDGLSADSAEGDDVRATLEGFVGTSARDHIEIYGSGAQSMQGGSGWDVLKGQSGTDTIDGQGGNDTISGGTEDDHLIGGPGIDTLAGDAGDDRLEAADGAADSSIDCGDGTDRFTRDANDPTEVACETQDPVRPHNTTRPTLGGTAKVGEQLTAATNGTWYGDAPITFTYRWQNCAGTGDPYADCQLSRTFTSSPSYTLTEADVGRRMLLTVRATNAADFADMDPPTFSGVVQGIAPQNTVRPVLSGTARVGSELEVTTGTWSGSAPISFTYKWLNCVDAANPYTDCKTSQDYSTDDDYSPVASDVGRRILAVVQATNSGGSSIASIESFSGVVQAAPAPPVNTVRPSFTGEGRVGSILTGLPGTWTGDGPITYAYRWTRCRTSDTATCSAAEPYGASPHYRLVEADRGHLMLLDVRATSAVSPTGVEARSATFSGTIAREPFRGVLAQGIEVTQGVQTTTNTVPLVAQRSTVVRVSTIAIGEPVTGRLHVLDGTRALTPATGIAPTQPSWTPPAAFDRADPASTLNFRLPAPTGLTANAKGVTFRVDLEIPGFHTESISAGPLPVLATARAPRIYYVPVDYTPSKLGAPQEALMRPGVGDAFAKAIFPVDDADPGFYQAAPIPPMTFANDKDKSGTMSASEGSALLDRLVDARKLLAKDGKAVPDNVYLHGWIAGNPTDHNGQARLNNTIGYNNTDPARSQRTFAHELAHNFGWDHLDAGKPASKITEVGWDVGNRLSDNPSTNGVAEIAKPLARCDIMCAGLGTKEAWIHTDKYVTLMDRWSKGAASGGEAGGASRDAIVISGSVTPSGDVVLDPVFRYPWRDSSTPRDPDGDFQLELKTESGRTIRIPFDRSETADVPGSSKAADGFEVVVETKEDLASLRATTRPRGGRPGKVLDTERPADDDPRLRVTAPRPGARLGERTTVRWRGRSDDALEHQVAYSPDGGSSWVPVAVEVLGRSITFDSTALPRTPAGQGVLRVFASDGLDSTYADVKGLSAPRARFGPW